MPTYSYRCTECGEAFDIQQAFTDDALSVCPNCGGKLRKLFNNVGVSFTGSGFYRNDSRAAPPSENSGSSGSSESSGSGGSGSGGSGAPAPAVTSGATTASPPSKTTSKE
ncbi:FmdB family zinc ribbon protein [Lysinimonas soli]|uniref:FmdB family zinc ribbon protein n=1 Tax=Lysinimonas soli TaxID=1074233 RepID=A0ABW0NM03_9MICO